MSRELVFEIGTEEIPAGYIGPALAFLEEETKQRFLELDLEHGEVRTAGTPRRLTLVVRDLADRQPDRQQQHVGPSVKAAYDEAGNPTRAAQGFARSRGVEVDRLQVVETEKGAYVMVEEEVTGRKTSELLPEVLDSLLRAIPFPKSMRWGAGQFSFARPLQWLLALYDGQVVPLRVEGISSGNQSRGHRFMAPESFAVSSFDDYVRELEERSVLVLPEKRRQRVIETVSQAVAARSDSGQPLLEQGLVDTVTNLVELPCGVCGTFDEKFLQLPQEVLITSMREHQKYFPVQDAQKRLLPMFVAVNNTDIADGEMAASGHERVLRARLEDALFFFNEDRKHPLNERVERLSGIVFQHRLGTMRDKTRRMVRLAGWLAGKLLPEKKESVERAALLAKADLLTEMVGEFPSLQGIIGAEYARMDGEPEEVAVAIREHYMPVRAGADLPKTLVGALVGLADRMDTLVGCFAIGERPTGTKDSFGLRRQAIGLINILRGLDISVSLHELAAQAMEGYEEMVPLPENLAEEVVDFIRLRFENELLAEGQDQGVVEAATRVGFNDVPDCLLRISALDTMRSREDFAILAIAFKRVRNISRDNTATTVREELLQERQEKELFAILRRIEGEISPLIGQKRYDQALETMLAIKEPLDSFFDAVMVMTENAELRENRLNLLTRLRELILQVGDISRIRETE